MLALMQVAVNVQVLTRRLHIFVKFAFPSKQILDPRVLDIKLQYRLRAKSFYTTVIQMAEGNSVYFTIKKLCKCCIVQLKFLFFHRTENSKQKNDFHALENHSDLYSLSCQ